MALGSVSKTFDSSAFRVSSLVVCTPVFVYAAVRIDVRSAMSRGDVAEVCGLYVVSGFHEPWRLVSDEKAIGYPPVRW